MKFLELPFLCGEFINIFRVVLRNSHRKIMGRERSMCVTFIMFRMCGITHWVGTESTCAGLVLFFVMFVGNVTAKWES